MHHFARESESSQCTNSLPHIHLIVTVLCKIFRHKSNTFYAMLALAHVYNFITIIFTECSIDKTIKIQQKVIGSNLMFKTSTIYTNMHSNDYTVCPTRSATVTMLSSWRAVRGLSLLVFRATESDSLIFLIRWSNHGDSSFCSEIHE